MSRSKRRLPEESRWLRVLATLNEIQARLFVADIWIKGEVESAECPS
jgi:hypothetical protein